MTILLTADYAPDQSPLALHVKHVPHVLVSNDEAAWETLNSRADIEAVLCSLAALTASDYALLKHIRAASFAQVCNVPVIVVTDEGEKAHYAVSLGANDVISSSASSVELQCRLNLARQMNQKNKQVLASLIRTRSMEYLNYEAERMWAFSRRHGIDHVFICIRLDPVQGLVDSDVQHEIRQRFFEFIEAMLAKAIRAEDCLGRSGSNEFLVTAMGISIEAAEKFARRLLDAVGRAQVNHQGRNLTVTASFGIAAATQTRANSVEELKQVALRRCGLAQESGGNRVVGLEQENHAKGIPNRDELGLPAMTVAEALDLIARGQQREVMPHLPLLQQSLEPLVNLMQRSASTDIGN